MAAKSNSENYILISSKTIFTLILSVVVFWLLIQIKEVVFLIFISLMLTLALNPLVDFFVEKKIPRGVAVLIIYFCVVGTLSLVGILALPPIISQTRKLLSNLPAIISSLGSIPFLSKLSADLNNFVAEQVVGTSRNVVKVTIGAFSGIFSVFSLLVITAYMLLDFENVREAFLFFLPEKPKKEARLVLKEVEVKLGAWLRGELILMIIVGSAVFVGLSILGISYAAPLGIIAGLLEIVPIIGPILSTIPGTLVGLSISPIMGVGALSVYILVQQLENNLIVPKVMQKAVGFNPLVTLFALLIGGKLFGVAGALIAIPATLVLTIVVKHILEYE